MSPARGSNTKLYLVATALMLAVTMWCLWRVPNTYFGMYGNFDGYWAAWNLKGLGEWSSPVDMSPFNPLSGLGSQFLPNLPWLNPAALVLVLPMHRDVAYVLSYVIYFIEISASLIFLCRTFRMSALLSAVASQVHALVLFPPWPAFFTSFTWLSLAPVNAHLIAVCNVLLGAFLHLGRRSDRENTLWALLILALTVSGFVSAPITFVTYAPAYGLIYVSVLVTERPGRRALLWIGATLAAVAGILVLSGTAEYLMATAANSARIVDYPRFLWPGIGLLDWSLWRELWNSADMCGRQQMLLCGGYPLLTTVHLLAVAGAFVEIVVRGSPMKGVGYGFLLLMVLVHFYHLLSGKLVLGSLHVISTPYLWWASYAFIAIFVTMFVARLASWIWRAIQRWSADMTLPARWSRTRASAGAAAIVLLATPAACLVIWKQSIGPVQPGRSAFEVRGPLGHSRIRTPHVGAVTRYLLDHGSVAPGAAFRGYTVTALGDPRGAVAKALGSAATLRTAHLYEDSRALLDRHFGNMFQDTDLWRFGIPTFEEYGQWITNQMLLFSKLAFTQHGDSIIPFLLRVLRPDFDILQSLGVRFVITDARLGVPGATLRAEDAAPGFGSIYLYELPRPNLGTLSPEIFEVTESFADSVRQMRMLGSRINEVAVVNQRPEQPFVPASKAELRLERDGFRLIASSPGRSYLLLPIQYSQCWTVDGGSNGTSAITLQRANAIASLVGFQGDVDVRFRFEFGPPGSSRCRKGDAAEYDSLVSSR